ncbi:MAG: ASKHA domain-containing protein [Pseudomonadota bacterium]
MKNRIQSWITTVSLSRPTLGDNTADADRLIIKLKKQLRTNQIDIDLLLLKKLPDILRSCNYSVNCILFKNYEHWILTGITSPNDPSLITGMAVDLGTTRVVIRLIDLVSGDFLFESSFDNPQIPIGPDILTRIHYADTLQGLKDLNHLIIRKLNKEISAICQSCKIRAENIYLMAVAGNTAMTHLFMGIKPNFMIREPYIPVVNTPDTMETEKLGIHINSSGRAFVFPNVGSYFGGDLIAGILYSQIYQKEETAILVDVGTNAEVVIGNNNWLIACAGAAGPALESGVAEMGMMAAPGAIDKVTIDPETLTVTTHTIDNAPPIGICGSGVIDLAAQLFLSGVVDIRGKLNPSIAGSHVKKTDNGLVFIVTPAIESGTQTDLIINQADLDSLSRSKAAMYTILETISASVGINLSELATFYVAGTFGSFINPRSAISIGMLPDLPLEKYVALGNSSLGGASMLLSDRSAMDEILKIKDRITYMELNVNQDFMNRFSAAKFFPHTDPSLFPSVKIHPRNQAKPV